MRSGERKRRKTSTRRSLNSHAQCIAATTSVVVSNERSTICSDRTSSRRSSMSVTETANDIAAIADNLRQVRERIANAAVKAGRKPEDVTLVAVSKTKPSEAVRAALAAGQTVFGENRIQEAADKFPPLRTDYRFQLHIIGGLQTNKARDA